MNLNIEIGLQGLKKLIQGKVLKLRTADTNTLFKLRLNSKNKKLLIGIDEKA